MAAGDFSSSVLLRINLKAERMWSDAQMNADFIPNSNTAVAVLQNQTARFTELTDRDKDNTIRVNWIKACDVEVEDGVSNCTITEDELQTTHKDYEIDIRKKNGFSIDTETLRTNIYDVDEVAARGTAKCIKELDEFWSKQMLIKIKTFASANLASAPFTYDAAKNATIIPAALYGVPGQYSGFQLPTLFVKSLIQNKIQNSYFIDNGRLFVEYNNSLLKAGATDGASIAGINRAQALNLNFDMFNFPSAGITNVTTFAIGKNAVAFRTKNRNPDTPVVIGGTVQQTRYTIPSISLPGVRYDVFFQITCTTDGAKERIKYTWRFETRGGIWLNPEQCPVTVAGNAYIPAGTYTPTGVLAMVADDEVV